MAKKSRREQTYEEAKGDLELTVRAANLLTQCCKSWTLDLILTEAANGQLRKRIHGMGSLTEKEVLETVYNYINGHDPYKQK